jgi:hypothetical protein
MHGNDQPRTHTNQVSGALISFFFLAEGFGH